VLASSGHIAGIINPPGGKGNYWTREIKDVEARSPEQWLQSATKHESSWWSDWSAWLSARAGKKGKPPSLGSKEHPPREDAPGTYVLEK
jgi:polyhydroxyalkanoate synthase